jgi:ferritin-like metal-binding protein YciE
VRQIENVERGLHEITRTLAEALGLVDIVRVLDQSRDEEDHMERALTVLGDDMIDTIAAEVAIIGRDKRQGTGVVSP